MTAGYSGTPLYKKLNLRPGLKVLAVGMPPELADLKSGIARVRKAIPPEGFVWASWPKKASGIASDITEDAVREVAFAAKLVDVKVCAVSEVWSGLKLVIRLKDRASARSARARGGR